MSQIKTVKSIINRLNKSEGVTGMGDKADKILHSNVSKKKKDHDHKAQELWDMLKRLNIRIQKIEAIQGSTKDTESLFTKVIAENPPNPEGKTDISNT